MVHGMVNLLVHDVINLLYYKYCTDKQIYFYVSHLLFKIKGLLKVFLSYLYDFNSQKIGRYKAISSFSLQFLYFLHNL